MSSISDAQYGFSQNTVCITQEVLNHGDRRHEGESEQIP